MDGTLYKLRLVFKNGDRVDVLGKDVHGLRLDGLTTGLRLERGEVHEVRVAASGQMHLVSAEAAARLRMSEDVDGLELVYVGTAHVDVVELPYSEEPVWPLFGDEPTMVGNGQLVVQHLPGDAVLLNFVPADDEYGDA